MRKRMLMLFFVIIVFLCLLTGSLMENTIFLTALIIFCLLAAAGLVTGNYFYNFALNSKTSKDSITADGAKDFDPATMQEDVFNPAFSEHWLEEHLTGEWYLSSTDHLKLHASALEQPTDRWAILCHGYSSKGSDMAGMACHFYDAGYSVLLPDARGHGKSQGNYIGMGWPDRKDVVLWIQRIIQQNPNAKILLYGISMGGATVMMTAGEELPENVKVIVEDCGYSHVWQEFKHQLKATFGLPAFPILYFCSAINRIRAGWWLSDGNAMEQLQKNRTPMMFIHGDQDMFVPFSMLEEVYQQTDVPKEKLIVKGAGHACSSGLLGSPYWEKVLSFTSQFIS